MDEIWVDVPDYEQFYQVSNFGRIRSKTRIARNKNGNRIIQGKLLKPGLNSRGYSRLNVKTNAIHKHFFIHRLVANIFVPNPQNKPHVNHLDSNPLNNHYKNLEWVSHLGNMHHAINKGRFDNHFKRLTALFKESNERRQKAVIGINKQTGVIVSFQSIQEAGRNFNNRAGDICRCCKGEKREVEGYVWEYAQA